MPAATSGSAGALAEFSQLPENGKVKETRAGLNWCRSSQANQSTAMQINAPPTMAENWPETGRGACLRVDLRIASSGRVVLRTAIPSHSLSAHPGASLSAFLAQTSPSIVEYTRKGNPLINIFIAIFTLLS